MRVTAPRGGEPYEEWIQVGLIGTHFAFDPLPLTDAEQKAERKKRSKALAKKIPIGFRLEHSISDPEAGGFPDVPRFDIRR